MEAHVALGDDHRNLGHAGVVVGGVPTEHAFQVAGIALREVAGHGVIAAGLTPPVTAVDHGDGAHFLVAVVKRDEGGQHLVRYRGRPVVLVEMPGHEVRGLGGDRRLVDQRRLEHADLIAAGQGGGDGADERLPQQPREAVVLVVHVVVVPLHVAPGRVPVGQLRWSQRQRAVALSRVVPLASGEKFIDLVVGEQLLAEVPAVLGVELDVGVGRQERTLPLGERERRRDHVRHGSYPSSRGSRRVRGLSPHTVPGCCSCRTCARPGAQ